MPDATKTNATLDALVKTLTLINGAMPILNGLLENEMRVVGLSREERHALRKQIFGETRTIANELQSNQE